MKKTLLLPFLFMATFSLGSNAQQLIRENLEKGYIPAEIPDLFKTTSSKTLSKKADAPIRAMYSMVDSARNYGVSFISYNNSFLFPDSTVKQIYGNAQGGITLGAVNIHSIGQLFDIKSDYIGDYTPAKTGYRLDSISIAYGYIQNIPGLADTLIFQFYTSDSSNTKGIIKAKLPNGDKTAWVMADINSSLGVGAQKQYKYLINQRDTTSGIKFLTVPVPGGMDVPAGQISGITITFKPGYSYNLGDTLDSKWNQPSPLKKLNNFKVILQNDRMKEQDNSYNHNLALLKNVKYNINAAGWENKYIPGDVWSGYNQHLYAAFQITYCPTTDCTLPSAPSDSTMGGTPTFTMPTAVTEINAQGYALGNIFPNPAEGNATLAFTLPKTENVKVQVYNVVGQLISTVATGTYASGNHIVNINAEGMKPGIYFYTIQAGNFTQTKRFSVVK